MGHLKPPYSYCAYFIHQGDLANQAIILISKFRMLASPKAIARQIASGINLVLEIILFSFFQKMPIIYHFEKEINQKIE